MKLFILLIFCLGFVVCRDRLFFIYPPIAPLESGSARRPAIYRSSQKVTKEFLNEENPIERKGDKYLDDESQSTLKSLKLLFSIPIRSNQAGEYYTMVSLFFSCRESIPSCFIDHFLQFMFRQRLNQKRYSISLDKTKSRFALVGKLEYSYNTMDIKRKV